MSDSENNNFNVKMRPTWNPVIFSVCILAGILAIYLVIHISIRLSSTTKIYKIFNVSYVPSPDCDSIPIDNIIMDPKQILKMEHERIIYELANYNSTGNAIELSALTPETNVRPLQSVILTTWRSGSTFFGDLLQTIPGSYYHFEPLLYMRNIRLRELQHSIEGLDTVRQLLKCNYTGLDKYLNLVYFDFNRRLWRICKTHPQFCVDQHFLSEYCRIFPYQGMKLVRMSANVSEALLSDPQLNVKAVLLVRDPRGTMASRKTLDWCDTYDCKSPIALCNDMVSDFKAAKILMKKYPTQFNVIRYEDLSLNPYNMTDDILKFYGLPFHQQVKNFLDSHTRESIGPLMSTFRDSKRTAFRWMQKLSFSEIQRIQSNCAEAMSLWGYGFVNDKKSLTNETFNTLMPFSLDTESEQEDES